MKQENIQRRENQAIREVFDRAGSLRKVMIVGLDYAAREHRAAFCNGQGDLLCKPVWVHNDRAGLAFVEARMAMLCSKHTIDPRNTVLGGETPGSWAVNFVHNLRRNGHLVIDLHAQDVKKHRENATTDNDNLSALTISQCLIDKKGREQLYTGLYCELRMAVRFHAKLVGEVTRIRNRIHSCADVCFPGLLDSDRSGVPAFGAACLWLLENHSPASVGGMRTDRLVAHLRKRGVGSADKAVTKLKELADQALPASEETRWANRWRLGCLIAQYGLLEGQERQAANEAARLLRLTPGALLTSVKGIGVKFAFQLTAELGDPDRIGNPAGKVNYFGLTEKSHQTGGGNKPRKKRGSQRRCNHFGKRAILGISDSVARWGPPEYRDFHMRRKLEGRNARYALGRKLLRFAIGVLKLPHVYAPSEFRDEPPDNPAWRVHLRALAEQMHKKWRAYPECSDPEHDVLGQWEEMARAVYKVDIGI